MAAAFLLAPPGGGDCENLLLAWQSGLIAGLRPFLAGHTCVRWAPQRHAFRVAIAICTLRSTRSRRCGRARLRSSRRRRERLPRIVGRPNIRGGRRHAAGWPRQALAGWIDIDIVALRVRVDWSRCPDARYGGRSRTGGECATSATATGSSASSSARAAPSPANLGRGDACRYYERVSCCRDHAPHIRLRLRNELPCRGTQR